MNLTHLFIQFITIEIAVNISALCNWIFVCINSDLLSKAHIISKKIYMYIKSHLL